MLYQVNALEWMPSNKRIWFSTTFDERECSTRLLLTTKITSRKWEITTEIDSNHLLAKINQKFVGNRGWEYAHSQQWIYLPFLRQEKWHIPKIEKNSIISLNNKKINCNWLKITFLQKLLENTWKSGARNTHNRFSTSFYVRKSRTISVRLK